MTNFAKSHAPPMTLGFFIPTQVNQNSSHDASTTVALMFTPEQQARLFALIFLDTPTPTTNVACMVLACFSILSKLWMINSGATDHIISNSFLLISSSALNFPKKIALLDGKEANITSIGTTIPNTSMSINDVIYIPSFQYNLLSIYKLT